VSLTLPSAYSSASKLSNIQENWIIQLGFFNGDAQGRGEGAWDAVLQMGGTANLLNEAVSEGETLVDVDDSSVFKSGDYIKVDNEIMKVLTAAANTLGLKRGQMGTTDTTHTNNTAIYWNNFTPIALSDTTVDDVFYHGVITNTPSVRSSINLANSTAKTGNISLSVVNFQYKGDDFSAELFLGTRKYINRNVKIYSQLNGDSTLSNCLQVYQGRLIDISHDDATIRLTIAEQRPWDFITFPQGQTSSGIYIPVSYGDFVKNSNTTYSSPAYLVNQNYRPILFESSEDGKLYFVSSSETKTDAEAAVYDKNIDWFIPVEAMIDDSQTSTESKNSAFLSYLSPSLKRGFRYRGTSAENTDNAGSSVSWTDTEDSFDTSTSTYAALTDTVVGSYNTSYRTDYLTINFPAPTGTLVSGNVNLVILFDINAEITPFIIFSDPNQLRVRIEVETDDGTNDEAFVYLQSGQESDNTINDTITLTGFSALPENIKINGYVSFSAGASVEPECTLTWDIKVKDVYITAQVDEEPKDVDIAYTGADGLLNSFTGGSDLADTGLEAHRDLLTRFAGFDDTDANIYNYDANLDIEASRITSAWNIRWWALEPVELEKILEQLQYEFCFIFKWRNGLGSYWFVKNSYSSGDVAQTLKKDDIAKLKINNTPFSELLTTMEINYDKHPAENRYLSSVTSVDSTNKPRRKWNIQSKENIKEIKLDMNVNKPGNANPGGGNPNDGFADYYMNIFGDVKKIISCDIVNPAVSYNLETGDIIQFSNTAGEMPVEPFGDDWQDYYMITNLNRSPGKVGITAREVG